MLQMNRWIDGGVDRLVKRDKVAYENSQDSVSVNEAFCSFPTHKHVSFGCYPCTRQILSLEELLSSKFLWEDLKDEEHGTHTYHTKQRAMMPILHENLLLLYASWCCVSQAVAVSYAKLPVKLLDGWLMLGRIKDGRNKELTAQNSGACSSSTLLFPRHDPEPPLDVILRKDISLMDIIKAHQ